MRLSERPSLVAVSCCRLVPSSYLLAFRLTDTVCCVACPLLPGFPPPLLSSISTLSAFQVSVVVPSGSLLRYRVESSRCGPPSGSSLSQSSIGTKALPLPSWCLVGVFAMSLSTISIRPTTLRTPSLGVGAESSCWGHPSRVVWRLSAHSIGTKAASIHLSLVASRWGHPTGRVWFFSHSIATKSSLVIWSVFLQDGVTLFGSGSNDLISSEGIPTVGLLGAFFRPALGVSFCLSLVGRSALKRGGFHIQLSSLLARTLCVSL